VRGESVIIEIDDSVVDDVAGDVDIRDVEDVDTFRDVELCCWNHE